VIGLLVMPMLPVRLHRHCRSVAVPAGTQVRACHALVGVRRMHHLGSPLLFVVIRPHYAAGAAAAATHGECPEDARAEGKERHDPSNAQPSTTHSKDHAKVVLADFVVGGFEDEDEGRGGDGGDQEKGECDLRMHVRTTDNFSRLAPWEGKTATHLGEDGSEAATPSRQKTQPSDAKRHHGRDEPQHVAHDHDLANRIYAFLHLRHGARESDIGLCVVVDDADDVERVARLGFAAALNGCAVVLLVDAAVAVGPQVALVEILQPQLGGGGVREARADLGVFGGTGDQV
jgi:hypothetical protein